MTMPDPGPQQVTTTSSNSKSAQPNPGGYTTVTVVPWTPGKTTPWNSTLAGIAAHFKTTPKALQDANPQITGPASVYPGMNVQVPR
jgi:LysM domain